MECLRPFLADQQPYIPQSDLGSLCKGVSIEGERTYCQLATPVFRDLPPQWVGVGGAAVGDMEQESVGWRRWRAFWERDHSGYFVEWTLRKPAFWFPVFSLRVGETAVFYSVSSWTPAVTWLILPNVLGLGMAFDTWYTPCQLMNFPVLPTPADIYMTHLRKVSCVREPHVARA